MKKIKEGLINEEIIRRYYNNVVDNGKGSGPRSHDYGKVVAEELVLEGADVRGIKPSFVRDKTR